MFDPLEDKEPCRLRNSGGSERGLEDLFLYFDLGACEGSFITVKDAMTHVKQWYGFGEWIAFKVADMLDRLGLCNIVFENATEYFFTSPEKGARCLWEESGRPRIEDGKNVCDWAVEKLITSLEKFKAPPRYERPFGVQEAETVLCKFHSYSHGEYRIGEDVDSLKSALLRFSKTRTSQRLLAVARESF